jgi:hypothetical protein
MPCRQHPIPGSVGPILRRSEKSCFSMRLSTAAVITMWGPIGWDIHRASVQPIRRQCSDCTNDWPRPSRSFRNRRLDHYSIIAILQKRPARSGSSFLTSKEPGSSIAAEREAIGTLNIKKACGLQFPATPDTTPFITKRSRCAKPSKSAKHETDHRPNQRSRASLP